MRSSTFFFIMTLIITLFFLDPGEVAAHPHVFVDCRLNLLLEGDTLKEISMNWEFDSMFSSFILEDHDLDNDGILSPEELKTYEKLILKDLKGVNYFSYLRTDGRMWPLEEVKSLKVSYDDPFVLMKIGIPMDIKIGTQEKEVGIAVYDSEYYISFRYGPDNEVSQNGGEDLEIYYDIVEDPDRVYYMGQVIPEEVVLYLRKR